MTNKYDVSTPEARKLIIDTWETGTTELVNHEGYICLLEIVKGESMIIKRLNEKNWYECNEYDQDGFITCDFVEKKKVNQ